MHFGSPNNSILPVFLSIQILLFSYAISTLFYISIHTVFHDVAQVVLFQVSKHILRTWHVLDTGLTCSDFTEKDVALDFKKLTDKWKTLK